MSGQMQRSIFNRFYRRFGKRALDLIISIVLLVILLPLLLAIALLVYITSPGPVLFVQDRLGFQGKTFKLYKFRTMIHKPRTPTKEIFGRDPELTPIGYWLRRFKLDELPQIFNVIKGDMSIVGPRPALPEQIEQYDTITRQRLAVRPGLTGLAQTEGNIYLPWEERWQYDVLYVRNLSFCLDIKIIIKTIGVILLGEEKFYRRRSKEDSP